MKIRPKVFEDAMYRLAKTEQVYFNDLDKMAKGCCAAISLADGNSIGNEHCYFFDFNEHIHFFNALFHQDAFYYWPLYEPGYTSRIIALQLAACVARDELLGSKGAGKLLSREQWNQEHKKQQEAEWAMDALNH